MEILKFRCPVPGCAQRGFHPGDVMLAHLRTDHGVPLPESGKAKAKALVTVRESKFRIWCIENGHPATTKLNQTYHEEEDEGGVQEDKKGDDEDDDSGSGIFVSEEETKKPKKGEKTKN